MTNENIRLFPHDKLLAATILKLIPRSVLPNYLTLLRFFCIPFILFFLVREQWTIVLPLFIFAALTDALDGSLARTRKQITMWGTIADPLADKLMIGSVMVVFVAQEVNPWFAALVIAIEILIIIGSLLRRRRGVYISANEYGKAKMVLQVVGVGLLLVAKLFDVELAVNAGVGTLAIAIIFAVVSLLTYGA